MPVKHKMRPGSKSSIRQSVTIPASLAIEVRRVAKEENLTVSRALVGLAQRGVRAEQDKKEKLKAPYRRFLNERNPNKKDEAGRDLIRAVFGDNAIAEDSVFWLPRAVWQHILSRVDERKIPLSDLLRLQEWVKSQPEAPEGDWYKDFGSFKLCGAGELPKTVLLANMKPHGTRIEWGAAPCVFLEHSCNDSVVTESVWVARNVSPRFLSQSYILAAVVDINLPRERAESGEDQPS